MAIIPAQSCERADVGAAVAAAAPGDVVTVPPGVATWTTTLLIDKAITVQMAGIDQTTIVDAVPKVNKPPGSLFHLATQVGPLVRLTGFTLDGGTGIDDPYNKAVIRITGDAKRWRLDHLRILATREHAFISVNGFTYGVIDHVQFDLQAGCRLPLYVHHAEWDGKAFGDGSWADDLYLGTEKAIFVEDCWFNGDGNKVRSAIDGWSGCRVVFRHNRVDNAKFSNHGSESSGRLRGARSFEIYHNQFTYNGLNGLWNSALELRSGNGVIYGNQVTGLFDRFGTYHHYRDARAFGTWGQTAGLAVWDLNDPDVHATGTHTGGAAQPVLTDASQSWTPDQWYGYSVHNLTQGGATVILANTATTVTGKQVGLLHGLPRWNPGDQYAIRRALAGMDQTGRGKGALLSGATPTPAAWPQQISEPAYAWNNLLNGQVTGMASGSPFIQEGREYFNTPLPGFVQYAYPHPDTYTCPPEGL